jgi:hypothetical protein
MPITYIDAVMTILVCGYVALTIVGISTTLWIVDFINAATGRDLEKIESPPWYYSILGVIYIFMYMWAIGFVSSLNGGRTKLTVNRAWEEINSGLLSPEETQRLHDACEELVGNAPC